MSNSKSEPVKWQKLILGFFKINWNAASDQRNDRIGIGALIRNLEGLVVCTLIFTWPFNVNPFTTDALTSFHAFRFCKDIGLTQLIIEGIALQVIQLLKLVIDWSHGGLIIQ